MRIVTLLLLIILVCAPVNAGGTSGYVNPELLVDQGELWRLWRSSAQVVVVLDVRSKREFEAGHLPTAQWIDIGEWKSDFADGTAAPRWGAKLGALGVDNDSTVVVYGATTSPDAARAWWILRYWGVADAKLLDGGWQSWTPPGPQWLMQSPSPTEFTAKPHPNRLATADEVLGIARSGGACLIDTRTDAEHSAGYIPTASHSDWTAYVDPETGKMHSAEQLQKLLDAAGFDPDGRNVAYCQSGGRASVVVFAMELMGGHQVENYFGSWGEWSHLPHAPVAKP